MRVLVCGGRDFTNLKSLYDSLDNIKVITCIIQGGARGADRLAKRYADENEILCQEFPADWIQYGKKAGFIRNKQMLDEGRPDLVVAFPGGRGTAMMIELAKKAGIKVIEVEDT